MRNTTKLKHILQLYTLTFDMDEEGNFHLTMIDKKNNSSHTLISKTYSDIVGKAFSHMIKELQRGT